jgi:siderophore synthetase component
MTVDHAELVDALTRERWEHVNRELIGKLLTELAFEDVLAPRFVELDGGRRAFELALGERLVLRYEGHRRPLGDWRAEPATIVATLDGVEVALPDAADVVAIGAPAVGADPATAAGLVGEVAMTALADALGAARGRPAAELLDLDPLELECELRGHPWIVASKGRLGFGAGDLLAYAPESARPIRLGWLAASPAIAQRRSVDGLDHATVVREQVGDEAWASLRARAAEAGLDPGAASYLPVHPWQWEHRVLTLHAGAIARGELVALGVLDDRYLPGQSLRTLAALEHRDRRHVKLALSILNTSTYRGLPRARTLAAPALTQWLTGVCAADPFLRETGMVMLGEVASVSVAHSAFEAIADVPYQHTEMLGAIWREPVHGYLRAGERAITMAALIHRDPAGASFAECLVARSGLEVDAWVRRLHEVTLPPLLHVLYRFGTTFSPHAQNCLVVLDADDVPLRLVVKDFVDDAMISSEALGELADMPPDVRAALGQGVEAMLLAQWIQCGLLVCVHRYLAEILDERMGYDEGAFWRGAERAVANYHERFEDELGLRFDLFDVEAPAFVKLCLNRVRILGRGYADAADRPVASASGWIDNPLALAREVAR